jgi:hypothetical protein
MSKKVGSSDPTQLISSTNKIQHIKTMMGKCISSVLQLMPNKQHLGI